MPELELVRGLPTCREVIEAWRVDHNEVRPHNSISYLMPEEFAPRVAAQPASPPHAGRFYRSSVSRIGCARTSEDYLMTGPKTGGRSMKPLRTDSLLNHSNIVRACCWRAGRLRAELHCDYSFGTNITPRNESVSRIHIRRDADRHAGRGISDR